jgi:hypothetical protein
MEKIFLGKVEYAGYEYNSVALTSAKAMSLLKKALKLAQKQNNDHRKESVEYYGGHVLELEIGGAYCAGTKLKGIE